MSSRPFITHDANKADDGWAEPEGRGVVGKRGGRAATAGGRHHPGGAPAAGADVRRTRDRCEVVENKTKKNGLGIRQRTQIWLYLDS